MSSDLAAMQTSNKVADRSCGDGVNNGYSNGGGSYAYNYMGKRYWFYWNVFYCYDYNFYVSITLMKKKIIKIEEKSLILSIFFTMGTSNALFHE